MRRSVGATPGWPGTGSMTSTWSGLHDFVAVDGVGVVAVFGAHVDVVAFGEQVDVLRTLPRVWRWPAREKLPTWRAWRSRRSVRDRGVEHVGAGALGGGTMIIRAKFGDVDDSEDLTVFRFAQPGGRGVRVPAGRGFLGRMRVKLLHEGADGPGTGPRSASILVHHSCQATKRSRITPAVIRSSPVIWMIHCSTVRVGAQHYVPFRGSCSPWG